MFTIFRMKRDDAQERLLNPVNPAQSCKSCSILLILQILEILLLLGLDKKVNL